GLDLLLRTGKVLWIDLTRIAPRRATADVEHIFPAPLALAVGIPFNNRLLGVDACTHELLLNHLIALLHALSRRSQKFDDEIRANSGFLEERLNFGRIACRFG